MYKLYRAILFLKLTLFAFTGFGQAIHYKMNYFSLQDGLSSREVFDAIQDNRGFIWVSVQSNLNRFDGYTFLDFSKMEVGNSKSNLNVLSKRDISILQPFGDHQIVVKYENDPATFDLINTDELSIKKFDLNLIVKNSKIIGFEPLPRQEKIVVIGIQNNELIQYHFNPRDSSINRKSTFSLTPYPYLKNLEHVQLSVAAASGITYLSVASLPLLRFDSALVSAEILPIPVSRLGYDIIKALDDNALILIDNEHKQLLNYTHSNQSLQHEPIPTITGKADQLWLDLDGNMIFGKANNRFYNELVLMTKSNRKIIPLDFILNAESKVTQLRGDHFLEQIIAPTYSGFYIFSNEKKRFEARLNQPLAPGQWGNILRSMEEDGKGNLYISEEYNHIYKLDLNNDSIVKVFKNSKNHFPIAGCMKKADNNLWGLSAKSESENQLCCFSMATEKFIFWDLPFKSYAIKDFVVLDSSVLLFFGRDRIVDSLAIWSFDTKTEKWKPCGMTPTLINVRPQIVLQDKDLIWIGTGRGFYVASMGTKKGEKVLFGSVENKNEDFEINALAFQPGTNNLFIGSEYGIWVYDRIARKYVIQYTKEKNGLSDDFIVGFLFINPDELFVTSLMGLSLFNLRTGASKNYYQKDGLADNEFDRLSFHAGSNSKYYFGGVNGLSIIDRTELYESNSKQAIISRFYKHDYKTGKEISRLTNLGNLDHLIIEPDDQYFGFDLMYPDYTEPRFNQFQTWLEGYDNDWQPANTNSKIRYGRLEKGHYTLHVRSFPNIGKETKIGIQVKGHIYQSPWFLPGISFVILTCGLGLFFNYRSKQRTKEIERQRNDQKYKDLEAAALRAQMNPHFIFNCLNSIQLFINEHDSASASKYLSNFARLVRLALHGSVDGRHSLQDEIDMLENYLGLERLRFGEKFTFKIEIDPGLDKANIFFPPLLIQPFVENALVHGISNKMKDGKINISFTQKGDKLHVKVCDNGPGVSTVERALNVSGHKSVGMTLTKHRLEILSQKDSFFMKPVLGTDGKAEGTEVEIVIPIA